MDVCVCMDACVHLCVLACVRVCVCVCTLPAVFTDDGTLVFKSEMHFSPLK